MTYVEWSPSDKEGIFGVIVGHETPFCGWITRGSISLDEYQPGVVEMLLKADSDAPAMTFEDAASYKQWMYSVLGK
jgi:hypothetical protein